MKIDIDLNNPPLMKSTLSAERRWRSAKPVASRNRMVYTVLQQESREAVILPCMCDQSVGPAARYEVIVVRQKPEHRFYCPNVEGEWNDQNSDRVEVLIGPQLEINCLKCYTSSGIDD